MSIVPNAPSLTRIGIGFRNLEIYLRYGTGGVSSVLIYLVATENDKQRF